MIAVNNYPSSQPFPTECRGVQAFPIPWMITLSLPVAGGSMGTDQILTRKMRDCKSATVVLGKVSLLPESETHKMQQHFLLLGTAAACEA